MQVLKQGFKNNNITVTEKPFDVEKIKLGFFKGKKVIRLTCPIHRLEYETLDEAENLCPLCLEEQENQEPLRQSSQGAPQLLPHVFR